MPGPPDPNRPHPHGERSGTLIETDEDVRQALISGLKGQAVGLPAEPVPSPSPPSFAANAPGPAAAQAQGHATSPYRPTGRPPMAVLTVYDDGKLDGEVIRISLYRLVCPVGLPTPMATSLEQDFVVNRTAMPAPVGSLGWVG